MEGGERKTEPPGVSRAVPEVYVVRRGVLLSDERLEARVVTQRSEVVVGRGLLLVCGPGGRRLLECGDRGFGVSEQALAARGVVEHHGVPGVSLEALVERGERRCVVLLGVRPVE